MKNLYLAIIAIFAFSLASGVSADTKMSQKSPESLVTCSSFYKDGMYTYVVLFSAISSEINAEMCAYTSLCNPCIESLEKQQCKVVDLKIDHEVTNTVVLASYVLSCKAP